MTIHNRHDFYAFSASGRTNPIPATFRHRKRRVDKAFRLINLTGIAKLIGQVRQNGSQHLTSTPMLKASMHRFVVRVVLRQHVPLRTGVQNPQHRLENLARGDRLASWSAFLNLLFGKMLPNSFPVLIAQFQHA